jgi:hypothetical protein
MLDVDGKAAIHRPNGNGKNTQVQWKWKKLHSSNENGELYSNRNTSLHSGFDGLATYVWCLQANHDL